MSLLVHVYIHFLIWMVYEPLSSTGEIKTLLKLHYDVYLELNAQQGGNRLSKQ